MALDPIAARALTTALPKPVAPAADAGAEAASGSFTSSLKQLLESVDDSAGEANAAVDGGDAQSTSMGNAADLLHDLRRELTRGRQDERGWTPVLRVQPLHHRKAERERLARAGGGLRYHVATGEPAFRTTGILAGTFLVIAVVWWRVFSLAVGALGRVLARPRVRTWLERLTGCVLVGLGVRVVLSR